MPTMEEIYQQHAQTVYKYLMAKTHDNSLSEELTQETFYQAIKSIHRFKGDCQISTWLCAIAGNLWRDYLKKKTPPSIDLDTINEPDPKTTEHSYFAEWNRVEVMKILHTLKDPMREVMYLRISGELSFKQIGEILGKSETWARVTYYRGKEKVIQEVNKL